MGFRVIIDGNAFYEIDEDCMKHREEKEGAIARSREVPETELKKCEGNRNTERR